VKIGIRADTGGKYKTMLFQGLHPKVTRARPTSNMMFSAAAIAVVSEVNPDNLARPFKL